MILAASALIAGVVAFAGVRLVERFATTLRLVDIPNERSSHVSPRPRGGGIGIVAGVVAAAFLVSGPEDGSRVWWLLTGALCVAAVGLLDDLVRLPVWPRLLSHFVAATVVVVAIGPVEVLPLPPPLDVELARLPAAALTVLWIVGVINFFNFMDGADGLAAGQAVVTCGALVWAFESMPARGLSAALTAASVAFLIRNWFPAKIFLGDVGSAFLGFCLATLPLLAEPGERGTVTLVVGLSLSLFLLDPFVTLMVRIRRQAPIGVAHREHAYQRLFEPTRSHALAVAGILLTSAGLTVFALAARDHAVAGWSALACAVLAFCVEWRRAGGRA